MNNIFLFLLLLSLLTSIQGKKHKSNKKTGSLKNSLPVNFTTLSSELSDIMELHEENNDKETILDKNSAMYDPRNQQRARKMEGGSLECTMCISNGSRKSDADCYKGISTTTQSCAESDSACYTQLHPAFIRRGCLVPKHLNITFVCKCPLCNDKTSKDLTYYKYTSLNDWEYDNERLSEKVSGSDLLCKVCETKGTNPGEDQTCMLGRNSDYMHCGHKQMCYTNINPQMGFGDAVSRGCIDMPVSNSYYMFCNKTKCNNKEFPNSRGKRQQFVFRTKSQVKLTKSFADNVIILDKFVWILSFIIQVS